MKNFLLNKKIYSLSKKGSINVEIGTPVENDPSLFTCDFSIKSELDIFPEIKRQVVGIDALQSLLLTFRAIGNELQHINKTLFSDHLTQYSGEKDDDPHLGFLPLK